MSWIEGSAFLFGGLVVAMGLGLPVALAFLLLNVIGAFLVRRHAWVHPACAQLRAVDHELLAHPHPVLRADGRRCCFNTGVALKAIDCVLPC